MTKQELQNKYPNTWDAFVRYFEREGWGASSANELSDYGFDSWFSDFIRENSIDDFERAEKDFAPIE